MGSFEKIRHAVLSYELIKTIIIVIIIFDWT